MLKPMQLTAKVTKVRSKGEKSEEIFLPRILNAAAVTAAPRRKRIPRRKLSFPSVEKKAMSAIPKNENTAKIPWSRLVFSLRKNPAKSATKTGESEIITPETAEEVSEMP